MDSLKQAKLSAIYKELVSFCWDSKHWNFKDGAESILRAVENVEMEEQEKHFELSTHFQYD